MRRPDSRSLLSRLWPAIELQFERTFGAHAESPAETSGDDEVVFADPVLRRMESDWAPPAPAPLPGPAKDGKAVVDDPEVDYYWVGSAARHAGTIVHRWLHRISDGDLSVASEEIGDLRAISTRWASMLGVPEREINAVCDRVESALSGILGDEKGRWILTGDGHAELALTGIVDDRVESVVIDRVRIDEDGTHWIIDYKTSTHEGGDLEGFLGQERDRYRPQLTRYASIYAALTNARVRTALYFPLLQAFTEIRPE